MKKADSVLSLVVVLSCAALISGNGCVPCPKCEPECECGEGIELEVRSAANDSMSAADSATVAFKDSEKARAKASEAVEAVQREKLKFKVAQDDLKVAMDKAQSVIDVCRVLVWKARCRHSTVIHILQLARASLSAVAKARAEATAMAHAIAKASANASSSAESSAKSFAEASACAAISASAASSAYATASITVSGNCEEAYARASTSAAAAAEAKVSADGYAKVAVDASADAFISANAVVKIFLDLGARAVAFAKAKAKAKADADAAILMYNNHCKVRLY